MAEHLFALFGWAKATSLEIENKPQCNITRRKRKRVQITQTGIALRFRVSTAVIPSAERRSMRNFVRIFKLWPSFCAHHQFAVTEQFHEFRVSSVCVCVCVVVIRQTL